MRKYLFVYFWIFVSTLSFGQKSLYPTDSKSKPVSHDTFDEILRQYVHSNGLVDYQGIKDNPEQLSEYIHMLFSTSINPNWSKNEKLTFWINAYNAFTLKLIVDNYPVKGIMSVKPGIPGINSVWDKKWINMKGYKLSLGDIEHDIIRGELVEPRIHFALNCASMSCPALMSAAYRTETLEEDLDRQARRFLYDTTRNKLEGETLYLSKIFYWYDEDFGKEQDKVLGYLNQFLDKKVPLDINVKPMKYNWKLNDIN